MYAKHGVGDDELWYRGTIAAIHRNDIGQWVDVDYDDGESEKMKPIKRCDGVMMVVEVAVVVIMVVVVVVGLMVLVVVVAMW